MKKRCPVTPRCPADVQRVHISKIQKFSAKRFPCRISSAGDERKSLLRFRHLGCILSPHALLVDFSSRPLRKLLAAHEDVLCQWHLELGQCGCRMLVDFLGCNVFAWLWIHSTADHLPQPRIREAKHRALPDLRMRVESGLHLGAVDILASPDDDVLEAVQDENETSLHLCDVPSMEEALRVDHLCCVLGPVLVALHVEVRLDTQLPSFTIFQRLPGCWVLDRSLNHKRDRLAAAGRMLLVINSIIDSHSTHGLCEAVALRRLGSRLPDLCHQRRRHWRSAGCDVFHTGESLGLEVRVLEHVADHGRHTCESCCLLLLNELESFSRIPLAHHYDGISCRQGPEARVAESSDVKHGNCHESLRLFLRCQ